MHKKRFEKCDAIPMVLYMLCGVGDKNDITVVLDKYPSRRLRSLTHEEPKSSYLVQQVN